MIVAIPTDEDRKTVCVSFGRAPYFLFHNFDTKESVAQANPAAQAQGGAGIQAAQFVVDRRADAVITVRCGQNSAEVLQAAGIAVYQAAGSAVDENLKALAEGKLAVLTHFHAGFHGHT